MSTETTLKYPEISSEETPKNQKLNNINYLDNRSKIESKLP
jgi:hypothetical protein